MSFLQPATVKAIAHSVEVCHLSDEAAKALAPDVEYRLREVVQDALKFARHCKRTKLTTDDIGNALRMRNIEPLFGFLGNTDPAKFVRAAGHPDVYFIKDDVVPLEQITCAPLPKAPNHATVVPHWLCINGVQPQTEENIAVDRPLIKRPRLGPPQQAASAAGGAAAAKRPPAPGAAAGAREAASAAAPVPEPSAQVQLPVQHILSDEMQQVFEQIKLILVPHLSASQPGAAAQNAAQDAPGASSAASTSERWRVANSPSQEPLLTPMQRAVLLSVESDPAMQQLAPYLTQHLEAEVSAGLRSLPRLHVALRLLRAMLLNPALALEPYLHRLMPVMLTCLLAKTLGMSPSDDHWSVRDAAARLIGLVCDRYGEPYYSLQVRVSKQLLKAFLDASKPLTSHYGAVVGLAALGHTTVRLLLLPQLDPYMAKLEPVLEAQREGVRQYEAQRVYGALLRTAGSAMYDRLLAAATDSLPHHLFRAMRPRRLVPELQKRRADATGTSGADAGVEAAAAAPEGVLPSTIAAGAGADEGAKDAAGAASTESAVTGTGAAAATSEAPAVDKDAAAAGALPEPPVAATPPPQPQLQADGDVQMAEAEGSGAAAGANVPGAEAANGEAVDQVAAPAPAVADARDATSSAAPAATAAANGDVAVADASTPPPAVAAAAAGAEAAPEPLANGLSPANARVESKGGAGAEAASASASAPSPMDVERPQAAQAQTDATATEAPKMDGLPAATGPEAPKAADASDNGTAMDTTTDGLTAVNGPPTVTDRADAKAGPDAASIHANGAAPGPAAATDGAVPDGVMVAPAAAPQQDQPPSQPTADGSSGQAVVKPDPDAAPDGPAAKGEQKAGAEPGAAVAATDTAAAAASTQPDQPAASPSAPAAAAAAPAPAAAAAATTPPPPAAAPTPPPQPPNDDDLLTEPIEKLISRMQPQYHEQVRAMPLESQRTVLKQSLREQREKGTPFFVTLPPLPCRDAGTGTEPKTLTDAQVNTERKRLVNVMLATDPTPRAHIGVQKSPPPSPPRTSVAAQTPARPIARRTGAAGEPVRSVRAVLAESWREDADLGEVVWALGELFGPAFQALLPQPGRFSTMMI